MADPEGEESLIFAAESISKLLRSKREFNDEEKKALADLRTQLSGLSLTLMNPRNQNQFGDKIEQLDVIQENIMSWETDQSVLWEAGRDEVVDYMNVVDETENLIEELENDESRSGESSTDDRAELLRRADDVLQTAMCRLEDEFRHLLLKNKCCFEPRPILEEDNNSDKACIVSFGAALCNEPIDSASRTSVDGIIDLVNPNTIPDLKMITDSMLRSNYGHESSQAFIVVQKDILQESMLIIEIERQNIEDVLRMEWGKLYSMIKEWIRVIRIFVRVYLSSELSLIDEIFGEAEIGKVCIVEASKVAILRLPNFGDVVSIRPHQPKKLFCIVDMYKIMVDLKPDIEEMYSEGLVVQTKHSMKNVHLKCVREDRIVF